MLLLTSFVDTTTATAAGPTWELSLLALAWGAGTWEITRRMVLRDAGDRRRSAHGASHEPAQADRRQDRR